jgi:hypothetical protein
MSNFPCTLCGSRNWPRPDSECRLCRDDEEDEDEETEENTTNETTIK